MTGLALALHRCALGVECSGDRTCDACGAIMVECEDCGHVGICRPYCSGATETSATTDRALLGAVVDGLRIEHGLSQIRCGADWVNGATVLFYDDTTSIVLTDNDDGSWALVQRDYTDDGLDVESTDQTMDTYHFANEAGRMVANALSLINDGEYSD